MKSSQNRGAPIRLRAPLGVAITLALGVAAAASHATIAAPTNSPTLSALWQPQTSALRRERLQMRSQRRASPVQPPVIREVASCADDGGANSLRAVVAAAASGDSIDLSQLQCSTITLTQGAIPVQVDDLTIVGPGAAGLTLDGNAQDRVLVHYGYGTLSLNGLTVSNGNKTVAGYHVALGACIASVSYLSLNDSVVTHCHAEGEGAYGGAVFGYGLSMEHSTITDSLALGSNPSTGTAAFGGGAFVYTLQLSNSTISGNSAQRHPNPGFDGYEIGGAIVTVHGGSVTGSTVDSNYSYGLAGGIASFDGLSIANSTISGNRAQHGVGGGLHLRVFADLALYNDTITNNFAGSGGGGVFLVLAQHNATTISSIISGNQAGSGGGDDVYCANPIALEGSHNLIGVTSASVSMPADTLRGPARLLALAANGGGTRTHALGFGSPAIDAGSNPQGFDADQRGPGFPRVFGAAADIGAYEAQQILVAPAPQQITAASWTALAALASLFTLSAWRTRNRQWRHGR